MIPFYIHPCRYSHLLVKKGHHIPSYLSKIYSIKVSFSVLLFLLLLFSVALWPRAHARSVFCQFFQFHFHPPPHPPLCVLKLSATDHTHRPPSGSANRGTRSSLPGCDGWEASFHYVCEIRNGPLALGSGTGLASSLPARPKSCPRLVGFVNSSRPKLFSNHPF